MLFRGTVYMWATGYVSVIWIAIILYCCLWFFRGLHWERCGLIKLTNRELQ